MSYVSFNMNFKSLGRQKDVWQQDIASKLGLHNLGVDTFPNFSPAGYASVGAASGSNASSTMRPEP